MWGWWRRCCGCGGGGRCEGGGRGVVIVVVVEVMDVSVVAGHRADVFFRFWEPYRAGEVLSIFFKMTVFSYFPEKIGRAHV